MSSLSLQVANLVAAAVAAGLLMVFAGTKKKLLRWLPAERRCSICGRTVRHGCRCGQ